jgi:VWFA-related protein
MFFYIALVALLAWITPQDVKTGANPTIKVRTDLVELRTVVVDRQGKPVENLKKEDFELLLNNRSQAIDYFSFAAVESNAEVPASVGGAAPAARSLRTQLKEAPVRTVILYVDNLHLAPVSLMDTKQALRRFVDEKLTPQDMVALVTSTGSLGIAGTFTRDRALLHYGIEKIGLGPSSRSSFFTPYLASCIERGDADALALGIDLLRTEEGIEGEGNMAKFAHWRASRILEEAAFMRDSTLLTLKELAAQMTSLPGQRMIVLFSDGFSLRDMGGHAETLELNAAISRAVRSGVAIYSIDSKGLTTPPLFSAGSRGGSASANPNLTMSRGGAWQGNEQSGNAGASGAGAVSLQSFLSASERDEVESIGALASDTGGQLYHNTNDITGSIARAFDANRSYYAIGYYRQETSGQTYQNIRIKVRNHPEYVVRAPKGYWSDPGRNRADEAVETPIQQFMRAMVQPLATAGIYVSANADYVEIENTPGNTTLAVQVDGNSMNYQEADEGVQFDFEVVFWIYDASGKRVQDFADRIQGKLSRETLNAARRDGFRVTRRVDLKPGMYQVRFGVRENGTNRFGTASAWLQVPDLERTSLVMSSLMLSGGGSVPKEGVSAEVGESPSAQGVRIFSAGQACTYHFRIQRTSRLPAPFDVEVQAEILDAGKTVKQSAWAPVSLENGDDKGVTVDGRIELTNLHSGLYELRVTVRRAAGKPSAQHSVVFGIE